MINRLLITLLLCISIFSQPYSIEVVYPPTLGTVSLSDGTLVTYNHESDDIDKFVLDSFALRTIDTLDNIGEPTVLYVLIVPEFKLKLYPIENPLTITGNSVESVNPRIYSDFELYQYDAPREGIAIVLDSDRELDVYDSKGIVKIFDAVGNLLHQSDMKFMIHNNKSYGIIVWDGRNQNGRVVSSGSYVVFVDASVVTSNSPSEYDNIYINQHQYHKILRTFVGVKIR